jgi:secreted Zn-dependent insulinase-like peptidase
VPVRRHGKNLNSDIWRLMQLRKATTGREDHPFAKFATGSYETLMSGPKVLCVKDAYSTSSFLLEHQARQGQG